MERVKLFIENNPNTIHNILLLLIALGISVVIGFIIMIIYKTYRAKKG